jgi:Toluene-4-monooxygenase system protein B (TmoB)
MYMSIPLYGFLEGDTLGLLVLAEEDETILELGRKLQDAAGLRVARQERFDLVYSGKTIAPGLTVAQAELEALDRFDVIWRPKS